MPKRLAPKPVRLGGKAPEDSLLYTALRGIAENLGNLLFLLQSDTLYATR